MTRLALFDEPAKPTYKDNTSGSFADNTRLPVHRWFRYSAGFSGAWAEYAICNHFGGDPKVFDPFAGSGTSLIAAEQCGVEAWGIDPHPFISRVALAKLAYRSSPKTFVQLSRKVIATARNHCPSLEQYPPIVRKCYSDEALRRLDCLRYGVTKADDGSGSARLAWLALVAILRPTSFVGTANCQYLLPKQRKGRTKEPFSAFGEMVNLFHSDMIATNDVSGPRARFTLDDARLCDTIPPDRFNAVITSPPYPNNYDYADATRLELAFFGEVRTWSDLQPVVRRHLLRSCTQHVPSREVDLSAVLNSRELDPIRGEIEQVCEELGRVRLTKGGKKNYHNMIACYFLDLARAWQSLRRVCSSPSTVCFVIGDSAPYGVYVPVMDWMGSLACAAGFDSYSFERIRARNIKWKNRKHRVPLCEGRLWVKG